MKKNNTQGLGCQLTRKSLYVAMATISHLMLSATPALGAPAGGKVVGGGGSIDQSGLNTTIRQQTDRMAIDWQSFNVAADEKVKFIQPDSSSIALNRVLSHTGSEIHGQIEANGQILLVNPNGVVFGKDSHINVGGIIASGLHIDPNDFMNGDFTLTAIEGTDGKVINSGIINASTGGSVTLVGQQVKNDGLISAKLGAVNLAAGKEAVITFDASGLVGVRVTEEVLQNELGIDAAVINSGEINAEGGRILLSASTSQDIFSQAVNHGNLNSATSVAVHEDGSFTLGAGADVVNTGNLSVSGNSGAAGQIVLIGENITTSGNIHADAAATKAGQIELHSVDTTLITDSAKITAKTTSAGKGGDVKILGNKVGLLDNAQINASGANGGGEILFGGDETGNNIRIRNADFIYLSENTKVNADAMLNGDGGRLITFASDTARIYGELSARGGALRGNGGFVETSGLKSFEILQTPDVTAVQGTGGHWLIDPYDITIQTGGELDKEVDDEVDEGFKFESGVGATTLDVGVLESALNGGVTVTVRTGAGDEGFGNINFATDLEYNFSGSATLILDAHNNIDLGIFKILRKNNLNGESLNVEMHSRSGNITFGAGARVITHGGIFKASGVDFTLANANTDDFFAIDTSINPGDSNANPGGNVTLNMTGAISLGSSIRTDGGNFTVKDSSSFTNNFDHAVIETFGKLGGGDISITSSGKVDLGRVNFAYEYDRNNDYNAIRSGSIVINTDGDVVLHKEIDFNNTEMYYDIDPNNGQDSFLSITAGGNISILKGIIDSHKTHEREVFDITLDAVGAIDIQGKIDTSGGNLNIVNSSSFKIGSDADISTHGQYQDPRKGTFFGNVDINSSGIVSLGAAINTNGGKVTINAGDTVTLNDINTKKGDANTSGALIISGVDVAAEGDPFTPKSINIQQSPSTTITAGNTVLNVGAGSVTLTGENKFTGDMIISSAGTVNIKNTTGLNLGKSNITDAFTLTTTGDITQGAGELFVGGITTLTANGGNVELNHANNDFVGLVNLKSISSVLLKDKNDLTLGNIDVSGTADRSAGNITLDAGGSLTIGSITANGGDRTGNEGNRNGGKIDLTANGDMSVASISTTGAQGVDASDSRTGGAGGLVSLVSNTGSIEVGSINTSGGDGHSSYGSNNRNGGNAGDISITVKAADQHIVLKGDLTAQGGKHGHSNHQNGAGKDISINGSVQLAGNINIDAGVKSGASGEESRGNITFNGSVDSDSAASHNLTLTANDITFGQDVGGIYRLGDLNINAIGNVVAQSADTEPVYKNITANTLNASATDFHVGNINTAATAADTAGGNITIAANNIRVGAINSSGLGTENGGAVAITASGNDASIELAGDINSEAGAESEQGQGSVNLTLSDAGSIFLNHTNFFTSTVNITGSNGVDTLNGFNIDSTWLIDKESGGNINNKVVFNGIERLKGGDRKDTFIFSGINNAGSISHIEGGGGEGENRLIGHDAKNTWEIGESNSLFLTDSNRKYVTTFEDINILQGGSSADTFNIRAAFNGNLLGGNGNDQFIFFSSGKAASVDGQGGSDTLTGRRDKRNTWTVSADIRSLKETGSNNDYVENFAGIEILQGGDAVDTFDITADFTGSLHGGGSADIFNLGASVTNVYGHAGDDKFIITAAGITASLEGGNDNDSLTGFDSDTNVWTISGADTGSLVNGGTVSFKEISTLNGGSGDDTFELKGGYVTTINGGGGSGIDTLIADDLRNTWTLLTNSSGTLASANPTNYSLSFSDIENLTGNAQVDTFNFNFDGTYGGDVDAVGADNIVRLAPGVNANISVVLGQTLNGVQNANIIMGNGLGSITVEGDATDTHNWTISDLGARITEADGIDDGEISNGTDIIRFINFINLNGSDATDNFTMVSGSSISGHIDGKGGTNTLINETAGSLWSLTEQKLTNNSHDVLASFSNIQTVVGSGTDTLIGLNQANDWQVEGTNRGYVQEWGASEGEGRIKFSGMNNLTGGTNTDEFTFQSAGRIGGYVDGGGGIDTLVGRDAVNYWSVEDSNEGKISSNSAGTSPYVKFLSIENLEGGKGADTFTFASSGDITGVIDGGTHGELEVVDTLDLASLVGEVHVELFKRSGTTYLQVLNMEQIIAPTATPETNFLYGASDRPYRWTIDGANSGTLAAAENPSFESSVGFSNFGQLRGGSNSDRFVFTDESRTLAGHIDGGSQLVNGEDIVDLSNLINADVSLSETTYINIEKIIGNEKGQLTNTETSVWTLLGDNRGKVNNILFEGFASLAGGDGNDTFNLTKGSLSGSVHGGKGDDTFTISGATIEGSVFGDAGNDTFIAIITPGNQGWVRFEGGDGNNSLEARGGNSEYRVQHDASNGEFSYTDKQNNKYDLSFTGITNITDNVTANLLEIITTSAADTITLKKDAYSLNAIDVNYTNKENLSIAASAADEVVISGAVNIPELLTIQDARVSAADNSSVITAKGLLLDGTAQVGTSANRLKVNIDNLYARYANGAIYLQEQRGLNIGEFSSSSLLDIRLEGDLTSSVALSSSQDISIATSNGNIVLDKENALSGGLNLAASSSIDLRNLTTTNLKNVSARNLTVNSTGVINGGGFIQVDGLASLVSGGNINLANQNHNFNFVQIGSAANVSINNVDSLRLTGVTASGALNINAQGVNVDGPIDTASVMLNAGQGDAVLSGNVAVDGKANVVGRNITVDGDLLAANIQLDGSQGQVLINGRLNTVGKESITVAANQVVQNGLMSAGTGVTMQASDSITQNAGITAGTDVLLSAGGDLFTNGRHTTQGQQVNYSAGGNMGLADIDATKGIKISAAGSVNQSGNIASLTGDIVIDSGRYNMEAGSALTASAGSVLLASSADVTTRKISAATEVSLTASGNAQILDEVTTDGAISIQGGSITLASNLIGNTGIDVVSANGNIQQQAQLNSAQGDIRVVANGDITMGTGSSTLSTNGSINYSGANLGITSFDALKTVTLAATRGAVTDVNGEDNNITAQRLVIDAATGIGSNDIIETLVEELSVSNNVGDIRLQNNKAVTVDRLRSNGNIVFNNLVGGVTLDNSQGTLFSRSETDARLAGGTMNANYDIGTLTINVAAGDLTATGVADLKNPDIVARNAALIAPIGNIGTFGRPLVIYVKDSLFIAGFNSWNPFWAFGVSPTTVDNASTIQGDLSDLLASGNETLVVVEALNEVDPAIFTNVRNYFYDDVSILLPTDQLYYGE